jgi:uroporphyrinogen III methyltransferase/synthase
MAVRWGTRTDQQTVAGTLSDLPRLVQESGLMPPATVVIGEVVQLRSRLDWFEHRPLRSMQIAVTRARQQSAELHSRLSELGAEVVEMPVIEMAELENYAALDGCIFRLPSYDWLVFTSTNAVQYFYQRLRAAGLDTRAIRSRVCAIGSATSDELQTRGLIPDVVPDSFDSEGVIAALERYALTGKRILLPRASAAREVIPETLAAMGAHVEAVDAYRNVVPPDAEEAIRSYFAKGRRLDWITFTSGSTVKNFLAIAGRDALTGVRVASIGPATSEVVRKHGLQVHAEANPSNMEGLVRAILKA